MMADLFPGQESLRAEIRGHARVAGKNRQEQRENPQRLKVAHGLVKSRQYAAAVPLLNEILRIEPGSGLGHRMLAESLAYTGKTAGAVRHFRDAIEIQPDEFVSHVNLGSILMLTGQRQIAERHFESAQQLSPGYLPGWKIPMVHLVRARKSDDARAVFATASEFLTPQQQEQLSLLLDPVGR